MTETKPPYPKLPRGQKRPELIGPPVHLSGPYILQRIKAQCVECDDCGEPWHWAGKKHGRNSPGMNVGSRMMGVRNVVYQITQGAKLKPRHAVTTVCHNLLCMNPALVKQMPQSYIVQRAVDAGKIHTFAAAAKNAKTRRAMGTKVAGMEAARAIRADTRVMAVVAAEHGISMQNGYLIRAGRRWKDFGSPFAGLMASNDTQRRRA